MDAITSQLAAFASGFSDADLTPSILHAAKERLVDSIGCALGAFHCEPARTGLKFATGAAAPGMEGYILFHDARAALDVAAFVNSCMIRNLDFNDRYPGGHPSDCLGALVASGFARDVSGRELLRAMAVTYEIFGRLSDGAMLSRRGWDQGLVVGLSAVGGLCNLLGMTLGQTANAVGMFASTGVPLRVSRAGELSQWKNVATAYAVKNAVFLTLLAREGMEGPARAFEGRNGLFENITGPFSIKPFPDGGGVEMTPLVQLKYWPVETNGQPVIWAALELKSKVDVAALSTIEVFTNKFTVYEIASEPPKWDPQTRETADHSLPYLFARALAHGPLDEAAFSLEAVRDPKLRPLMNMIKVTADPAIDALPAGQVEMRVIATTRDGQTIHVNVGNPLGHPDNPMREPDISDKFRRLAEPVVGAERAGKALAALWAIDGARTLADIRELLNVRKDR